MITVKMLNRVAVVGFLIAGLYYASHVATFFKLNLMVGFASIGWSALFGMLTFNPLFLLYMWSEGSKSDLSIKALLARFPLGIRAILRLLYVYYIAIFISGVVREGGMIIGWLENYFVFDEAFFSFFSEDLFTTRIFSFGFMSFYLFSSLLFWYAQDDIFIMNVVRKFQNHGGQGQGRK